MALKRTHYEAAFQHNGEIVEIPDLEVWGVDELRAELEGRRLGLRGPTVDRNKSITDLGDAKNREALEVWAALVRLGKYDKPAHEFQATDYIGSKRHGADDDLDGDLPDGTEVPPTPQADSTNSA